MGLLELFKFETVEDKKNFSSLHEKVSDYFPNGNEREIIIATCVAGLLSRVAYVDLEITEGEVKKMKEVLQEWTKLSEGSIIAIREMAISEMKELCGLENHLYVYPLNDVLDKKEKNEILSALFAISAADGSVSSMESEEIRTICKGLKLPHDHYIAARATVAEKLAALKK